MSKQTEECPQCQGHGEVAIPNDRPRPRYIVVTCERCGGSGRVESGTE